MFSSIDCVPIVFARENISNADRSIFVGNSDGDDISAASLSIQQGSKIDVHLKKGLKLPSDLIWSSTKGKPFSDTLLVRSGNRGRGSFYKLRLWKLSRYNLAVVVKFMTAMRASPLIA